MIRELNSQIEFVKNEQKFLSTNTNEVAIIVLDNTEVCYGADDSCNTKWCDNNNISYIHQEKLNGGGCIVGVKGNIFIDAKIKDDINICLSDRFSLDLCNYLKSLGLSAVRQDNNDVLIENFKVASGCETNYNGYKYMGYQISMNQDLELISHICNKPMIKTPKGLSEFGIKSEDIINFCKEYFKCF